MVLSASELHLGNYIHSILYPYQPTFKQEFVDTIIIHLDNSDSSEVIMIVVSGLFKK